MIDQRKWKSDRRVYCYTVVGSNGQWWTTFTVAGTAWDLQLHSGGSSIISPDELLIKGGLKTGLITQWNINFPPISPPPWAYTPVYLKMNGHICVRWKEARRNIEIDERLKARLCCRGELSGRVRGSVTSWLCLCVSAAPLTQSPSSLPSALLYKPIDRVTRSTLVLHVSTPLSGWRKEGIPPSHLWENFQEFDVFIILKVHCIFPSPALFDMYLVLFSHHLHFLMSLPHGWGVNKSKMSVRCAAMSVVPLQERAAWISSQRSCQDSGSSSSCSCHPCKLNENIYSCWLLSIALLKPWERAFNLLTWGHQYSCLHQVLVHHSPNNHNFFFIINRVHVAGPAETHS